MSSSIAVSKATHSRLQELCPKSMTYDAFIDMLMFERELLMDELEELDELKEELKELKEQKEQ